MSTRSECGVLSEKKTGIRVTQKTGHIILQVKRNLRVGGSQTDRPITCLKCPKVSELYTVHHPEVRFLCQARGYPGLHKDPAPETPLEWATHIQILVIYPEDPSHHPYTPCRTCTHTAPYPAWLPSANHHLCTRHAHTKHDTRVYPLSDIHSGQALSPHTRPQAHNLRCARLTPKRGACVNTNPHVRVRTRRKPPTGHTDPGTARSERLRLRPGPGRLTGGRLFRPQPLPGPGGGCPVLIAGFPGLWPGGR